MALNNKIFDPVIAQVGTAATIGGSNPPYKKEFFTNIDYSFTAGDYHAGAFQYCIVAKLVLSLGNAKNWIQFRDANPIEYDLGSYAWVGSSGVIERGNIHSLSQSIRWFSRIIRLSRNESARAKRTVLSSRPRLLASSSARQGLDISGPVSIQPLRAELAGILATVPPGSLTLGGFLNPTLPGAAQVVLDRRAAVFDVTDGTLEYTTTNAPQLYRPGTNINNTGEQIEANSITLFLRPGVTGTLKLTAYHCGEEDPIPDNPNGIWVNGNLPTV